jgi:ACS family tartrate transporter-like MFS transporter
MDIARRTQWRITRRLIPFLFLLYLIAFLDRVNVSFAALQMTDELGMTPAAFGFGAGVFFIGYVLLEIPCAVLVETWSARKLLARIMVSWGILAACTAFVQTPTQFYVVRFLLGMAEAGFFPGVIVYLSNWYREEDRAKAVAMFMAAIPVSELLGAPISGLLMQLNWLGWSGWRWMLLLEGLPAVVLGVITLFYLTDRPEDAKWLPDDERNWLKAELGSSGKKVSHGHSGSIWAGLSNPRVLLLTAAYFTLMSGNYGLMMWLPKILKTLSGATILAVTVMTAIPFLVAVPVSLMVGFHSDATGERKWHGSLAALAAALGLALLPFSPSIAVTIGFFAIAVAGNASAKAPFWAIATAVLSGKAKAASIGLINSLGNLGGFVGPYVVGFLTTRTSTYASGLVYLSCCFLVAASLIYYAGWSARRTVRTATAKVTSAASAPGAES